MRERDDLLLRFGTDEPVPALGRFQAGALICEFDGSAVRRVTWQGTELLRGVAYLLRDRDWGTAPARVSDLLVDESAGHFALRFVMHMTIDEAVLEARAQVDGQADGRFAFSVHAVADHELLSSRCGFVVLHPASCAGLALEIEHGDGRVEATQFPRSISPGQPAFDIRALRWSPEAGLNATCRMEAELPGRPDARFEMEDQRNWSDASFKTYVGSLLDPWPYRVPAGVMLHQQVSLNLVDKRGPGQHGAATTAADADALLRWVPVPGRVMPPLGVGVPHLDQPPNALEHAALAALRPACLIVQLDLSRKDVVDQLALAVALANSSGAQIQLDVLCPDDETPQTVAGRVRQACRRVGLDPAAVRLCPRAYLTSYQPTDRWPQVAPLETYARAARHAFPAARIGGGMVTNFTELNRRRQGPDDIDFIGHTSCPIVHAADERSVMETLQALPAMGHTVREVWPGLGWRIGPLALAAARNPYGRSTLPNPARQRLALADADPRHQARFGAAWVAGCAAVLAPLGVELLALLDSHGPSGPLLADRQPGWQPGATVPAWAVLNDLVRAQGRPLWIGRGLPPGLLALGARDAAGVLCGWVINTTAEPQVLRLKDPTRARRVGSLSSIGTAPVERLVLEPFDACSLSAA